MDDVLCALAKPGDTFLDIGANMGYYTVKIGSLVGPNGKIFSFEPNPDLFEVLSDNIQINGFVPRAFAFNAAAADVPGTSTLVFETRYPGGGRVVLNTENADSKQTSVDVQVLRIDDVVPHDVVADLIKIDVEGFEPLVLRGMTALLARSPAAAIVTEVSYVAWERFGDPAAALREVAGDRLMFAIHVDGRVEKMADDLAHIRGRDFVSYVLMLPNEHISRIAHLMSAPASSEGHAFGASVGQPKQPLQSDPPVQRSLLQRAGAKLKRMALT